jgi:hypothetical protein
LGIGIALGLAVGAALNTKKNKKHKKWLNFFEKISHFLCLIH